MDKMISQRSTSVARSPTSTSPTSFARRFVSSLRPSPAHRTAFPDNTSEPAMPAPISPGLITPIVSLIAPRSVRPDQCRGKCFHRLQHRFGARTGGDYPDDRLIEAGRERRIGARGALRRPEIADCTQHLLWRRVGEL